MHPNLKIIFSLFGGLAIFIYGMNMMSDNLQKTCGNAHEKNYFVRDGQFNFRNDSRTYGNCRFAKL